MMSEERRDGVASRRNGSGRDTNPHSTGERAYNEWDWGWVIEDRFLLSCHSVADTEAKQVPTVYQERGHTDRSAYLRSLSEDFGVPLAVVYELASLLGADEDFDLLLITLGDYDNGTEL